MNELEVKILRGENKVGENLIEVTDGETRVLLECGVALEASDRTRALEEEVIKTSYDCVIVTHCHADHSGLLKKRLSAQHIYMGEATFKILEYCGGIHEDNKPKIRFMQSDVSFLVGAIEVKAYLCDHSAYDSYMVELRKGVCDLLYTGDFRSNGRKSFEALARKLPKQVEYLIIERTNPLLRNRTERDLEEEATELFKACKRIFILQSSLNIDRTVTFYRAAKRTGKAFIMSKGAADIGSMYENIPSPVDFSNCYTYFSRAQREDDYTKAKAFYDHKLLGYATIAKMGEFVMQIHSGMLGYLQKLSRLCNLNGCVLVYSMWQGYKSNMADFLHGLEMLGIRTVDMHVSGHADVQTAKKLIAITNPKQIYMVHCEK